MLSLKPFVTAASKTELESKISEKEFMLEKNTFNIQSVYFTFNGNECSFAIKRDDNTSIVKGAQDGWKLKYYQWH